MLDRGTGEHGFQLHLQHRPERAEQHRGRPHGDQHRPPPGLGGAAESQKTVAEDDIEGDFHHAAGHQRRNAGLRRRMRARQPAMQRRQPGFGAGAQQDEHESEARSGQEQRRDQAGGGENGDADIKRRRGAVAAQHQQPGGSTHQLEAENQGETHRPPARPAPCRARTPRTPPNGACRRSRWPPSAAASRTGKSRKAHQSADAFPARAAQISAGGNSCTDYKLANQTPRRKALKQARKAPLFVNKKRRKNFVSSGPRAVSDTPHGPNQEKFLRRFFQKAATSLHFNRAAKRRRRVPR